jgi:hypothetical protein
MSRKRKTMPASPQPLPVPGLTPPVRTETSLDHQVAMLTAALGNRLALAQAAAEDPEEPFSGGSEIDKAVELARATAELARAKARLLGESIRYQVLRVDGKEAARLARNDYWPQGITEHEAATLTDDELLARYALPPRNRGPLAPKNEPFEIEPPRDPDAPTLTEEELHAIDGTERFMARLEAYHEAKKARLAAEGAAAPAEAAAGGA